MASSYKEPITINITMTPKELRDLADNMEYKFPKLRPGDSTFVAFLAYDKDYVVKLMLDQTYWSGR